MGEVAEYMPAMEMGQADRAEKFFKLIENSKMDDTNKQLLIQGFSGWFERVAQSADPARMRQEAENQIASLRNGVRREADKYVYDDLIEIVNPRSDDRMSLI